MVHTLALHSKLGVDLVGVILRRALRCGGGPKKELAIFAPTLRRGRAKTDTFFVLGVSNHGNLFDEEGEVSRKASGGFGVHGAARAAGVGVGRGSS